MNISASQPIFQKEAWRDQFEKPLEEQIMRVYIRLRVINLMFSSVNTKEWYVFTYLYEVWNTGNSNWKHCTYIFWFCNSFVGAWYVTHWIVDIPFHQAWERFSIYILTRLLFASSPEKSLLLQEVGIQLIKMKYQSSGLDCSFLKSKSPSVSTSIFNFR